MKITRFIIALIISTVIIGFNKHLFSWGLFNLFTDKNFSKQGLNKVENFNPDKDILYLPPLNDKDLFESTRDLSICRKKAIRKHIYKYLTSKRAYTIRAIEKSYVYRDIIEKVFEENKDIPDEIALLPLLESGFNPHAVSKSNAVGLWQFVKNTSTPLGLKRNKWIDERRNIFKSTEAALKHLRNHNKIFKSWELTLAAYNGGGGYIMRLMQKTGAKNFWELRESGLLRLETYEYVPKFIALLLIYKNQRLFGIKDEIDIPDKYETAIFALKHPVNVKYISKLSGVPVETIKKLNPELNRNITPPTHKKYSIRLPQKAMKRLIKNKRELYKYRITRLKKYRIKKGECISIIAKRYKKKLAESLNLTV